MNRQRNISIRLVTNEDLPENVSGCCAKLPGEDNYLMALNAQSGEEQQLLSYLHECLHIWHRDHDREGSVEQIEKDRHEELAQLLKLAQGNTW